MKKILITGASGFIGSFLVEEALRKGWQTWAGIRPSSSKIYLQDSRIQFINLDYSNKEQLKKQIEEHIIQHGQWDYIIHNAGITKCANPWHFRKVNYLYTRHFVEVLIETGNIPQKFLLMSSFSTRRGKSSWYALSKDRAAKFLLSVNKTPCMEDSSVFGEHSNVFPYIVLCPTGVYGPRDKDYLVILKMIQAGFDIRLGIEKQFLSFIYVKDLVKATFLALESPIVNQSYCIADNFSFAYSDDLCTAIFKEILGKKLVLKIKLPLFLMSIAANICGLISFVTGKAFTFNRDKFHILKQRDWSCLESVYAQVDLGFNPEYDLMQGMKETVEWYRTNGWL